MRKRHMLIALGLIILFGGTSYADSIKIPLPPVPPVPPVPEFRHEPSGPPEVEFVVPPPPPFISVEVSHPDYWFYDDDREGWFWYEKGHNRRYVKRHKYRDDGKHFHAKSRKWRKVDKEHAHKKGWMKKHKAEKKVKVKKKKWYRFWGDD